MKNVILIVEDEPLLRLDLKLNLEAAGWEVVEASTGEDAVAILERQRPRLVFTDIQLGGTMDGWQVGTICRARGVPVIYTSGQDRRRHLPRAAFLPKPYSLANVVATCDAVVRSERK